MLRGNLRGRCQMLCEKGDCKTEQHHAPELSPEYILQKYSTTGVLSNWKTPAELKYLDSSTVQDVSEATALVQEAEEFFSGLPASIKKQFEGDSQKFFESIKDPVVLERLGSYSESAKKALSPFMPEKPVSAPADVQEAKA